MFLTLITCYTIKYDFFIPLQLMTALKNLDNVTNVFYLKFNTFSIDPDS